MQNPSASFTAPSHQGVTPVPEMVPENSHTNLSLSMPQFSRESLQFNATRPKSDGFCELELEDGGQRDANFPATSVQLAPIKNLAPRDGGWRAWAFLASAWMIEAVLWGLPATFGIFQAFYSDHPKFRDSPNVPIIGSLSVGIPFIGAPFFIPLVSKFPRYHRHMVWFGCTTCLASLVLASFATQVWHLIVTQGALFGTGFLVLYYPVLSMLQEWFVERRGLAFGIIFGATGVAGAALPFLINHLLLNYGFASTLRYYAVGAGILLGATLPFCNPRNPIRKAKPIEWSLYWTLATKPAFLLFWIANLFQGVAFFLPSFNIPTYAGLLSISPAKAAIILCGLNGSQVFSQALAGWASDKMGPFGLVAFSTFCSALAVGVAWYSAQDFAQLMFFGVLFGMVAGGYSALWPRFICTLTSDEFANLFLYSLLAAGRGVGNLVASPLGILIMARSAKDTDKPQSQYRSMILFVAAAFLLSFFISVSSHALEWLRNRKPKPSQPSSPSV